MSKAGPGNAAICTLQIGPYRVEPDALTITGPAGTVTLEPKVMDVLLVLAGRRGEVVLRSELIEAVWAVEHGGDESLTRAISILRKILGDVHGQRTLIETVPRRGYRLLAGAAAAEPVLAPPAAAAPKASRIAAASALAAAVLIGSAALLLPRGETSPAIQPGVVSVGQFTIAGNDTTLSAIAEAMPATVSTGLSRNGLRPIAAGQASRPDVQYRLTGSVSRQGSFVRTDMHLTDPASDQIIWSLALTASEEKAVRLADYTSVKAAQMLRCLHDLRSQVPASDTDALILLRDICENAQSKPLESSSAIRTLYAAEPDNTGAKALSAFAMASIGSWTDGMTVNDGASDLRAEGRRMAEEVLAVLPNNAFANLAMASLEYHNRDLLAEEAWLLRAIRQGGVRNLVAPEMVSFLRRTGRLQEASFGLRETLRSYPSSSMLRTRRAWIEASMGNPSEAQKEFDIVQRNDPGFEEFSRRLDQYAVFHDDPAVILERKRAALAANGRPADNGERCNIIFLEEKLSSLPDGARVDAACVNTQTDWRIRMFTQLGDLDLAYAEAELLKKQRNDSELVLFYPDMALFRNDLRFWPLAADLGLARYWSETKRWPDFCRERNLPQPCETGAAAVLG